jgi:hypothetical protein
VGNQEMLEEDERQVKEASAKGMVASGCEYWDARAHSITGGNSWKWDKEWEYRWHVSLAMATGNRMAAVDRTRRHGDTSRLAK